MCLRPRIGQRIALLVQKLSRGSKSGFGLPLVWTEIGTPGSALCSRDGLKGKKSSIHLAKQHLSTCHLPLSIVAGSADMAC